MTTATTLLFLYFYPNSIPQMTRFMNNIAKALAASSLIGLVFTGCQKQTLYTPSVVATIGSNFRFSAVGTAQVADSTHAGDYGTTLAVVGLTSEYQPSTAVQPIIRLYIPQRVGTYSINKSCSAQVVTAISGSKGSSAVSGTIVVTGNAAGRIEGTFTFNCADGETVTAGQFYAPLPQ
jgi:hypothetical protein